MSRGPIPIQRGFLYQAYYFWWEATRLFARHAKIGSVGYEINDSKAFDDVAVDYAVPIRGEHGEDIKVDFFQLKFHQDHSGNIAHDSLVDPAFIGAKKTSFLQRVALALASGQGASPAFRIHLVTPWGLKSDDPICEVIGAKGGEFRLDKLRGAGARSELGKMMALWQKHLGLPDEESLMKVLTVIRILPSFFNLEKLKSELSFKLEAAGLEPFDLASPTETYSSLIWRLCDEGKTRFTKTQLTKELKAASLYRGEPTFPQVPGRHLGVRSFRRYAENLEDETEALLPLEGFFDGRFIKDPADWNGALRKRLLAFVEEECSPGTKSAFYLDTHSSIALALGTILDPKRGVDASVVQKTAKGTQVWSLQNPSSAGVGLWEIEKHSMGGNPTEVAVAISVSQNVLVEVQQYLKAQAPNVGVLLSLTPKTGVGQLAVRDGDHAWRLAEEVVAQLKTVRSEIGISGKVHLFFGAPNTFVFFLGRQLGPIGNVQAYEFDFTREKHGTYEPSVFMPWRGE